MEGAVFSAEDLSKAFDRAIGDVRANSTTELASLSVLLQVLGDFRDDGLYLMAGLILGQLGGATFQLRNLQTLDPTVEQVLRTIARELGEGLTALKAEFTGEDGPNAETFNEIMGNLAKVQWRLIQRLNVVQQMPFGAPFGGPGEE